METNKEQTIKYIDIAKFRSEGFLQELNRQFLHPLGLALELIINDDGTEKLGGIWDYREEGIYYDLQNSSNERIEQFRKKAQNVEEQRKQLSDKIIETNGWIVEPIPMMANEIKMEDTNSLTEWETAILNNKHHFWCNYDPRTLVGNCPFCKKAYIKYPPSKGEDALLQEHFPDAIKRN